MRCVTIKRIRFTGFNGLDVSIPKGATIIVDYKEGIAFYKGDTFTVSQDEWRALN